MRNSLSATPHSSSGSRIGEDITVNLLNSNIALRERGDEKIGNTISRTAILELLLVLNVLIQGRTILSDFVHFKLYCFLFFFNLNKNLFLNV